MFLSRGFPPAPHHILVMLQNPSEIRPAGGFLGSYADVTIASGTITDISVHDIADVDMAFTQKIVPPKPLQLEVARLRPADANWFFDFPSSASKTISFFNESSLYSTDNRCCIHDIICLLISIRRSRSRRRWSKTCFGHRADHGIRHANDIHGG